MSEIDVRVDRPEWQTALTPSAAAFVRAVVTAAMDAENEQRGVDILLSGDEAVRVLNASWRGKDSPTNVLSFPSSPGARYCGDIVLAFETVAAEAAAQNKTIAAHAAHLLTHGFLHLLGYDHEQEADAQRMEARERQILDALGYSDPYAVEPR